MNQRLKGYTGTYGHYKPADRCSIPQMPAAVNIISGFPLEKQWGKDVFAHVHVKNLVHQQGSATQGNYLTFGGYAGSRRYAIFFYHYSTTVYLCVTSAKPNTAGQGKFIGIVGKHSGVDGEVTENANQKFISAVPMPSEWELFVENEKLTIIANGKTYYKDEDISGSFEGVESAFPSSAVYINGDKAVSFDLVDFTYESDTANCRFVPMKTADGKNAIYEVYSKQVVEI